MWRKSREPLRYISKLTYLANHFSTFFFADFLAQGRPKTFNLRFFLVLRLGDRYRLTQPQRSSQGILFFFIDHTTMFLFIDHTTMFLFIDHTTMFLFIDYTTMFLFIDHTTMFLFIDHTTMFLFYRSYNHVSFYRSYNHVSFYRLYNHVSSHFSALLRTFNHLSIYLFSTAWLSRGYPISISDLFSTWAQFVHFRFFSNSQPSTVWSTADTLSGVTSTLTFNGSLLHRVKNLPVYIFFRTPLWFHFLSVVT